MIVKRDWSNDYCAFMCAKVMDEMGIRIVAVTADRFFWSVWGQAKNIDYNELDRRTNLAIDGEEDA